MRLWCIFLSYAINLQAATSSTTPEQITPPDCPTIIGSVASESRLSKVVYPFIHPPDAQAIGLKVVQEKKSAAESGKWLIYANAQSGELLQFKSPGHATPTQTFTLYRKESGKEVFVGYFLVYPQIEEHRQYAKLFPVLEDKKSIELRGADFPNYENFNAMISKAIGHYTPISTPMSNETGGIEKAQALIPPQAGEKQPGLISLVKFPGVYNSGADKVEGYTYNLLKNVAAEIKPNDSKRILVLGAGAGYETVALKHLCPSCEILATEIDPLAKLNAELNLRLHGFGKVEVRLADLFSGITGKFDVVVFAPPRAVGEKNLTGLTPHRRERNIENWKANPDRFDIDGKILKGLFKGLPEHLSPGGKLFLMSEKDLSDYLPPAFQTHLLHEGRWSLDTPAEGTFAIHRIQRR